MDGTYILREAALSRPHPTCQDNCVYSKVDDFDNDYCFQEVDQIEGANIQCEAVSPTEILSTLSTESIEILLNTTMGAFGPTTPITAAEEVTTALGETTTVSEEVTTASEISTIAIEEATTTAEEGTTTSENTSTAVGEEAAASEVQQQKR